MYIVDYCCTLVYIRLIAFAPLDVFLATGLWRYCSGCCFEQHRPSFGCGWQLPKAAIRVFPYFRIKLKTTSDVRSWWDDMGSLIHYPHIACILSPKFPHDWAKLSEASAAWVLQPSRSSAPSEQRATHQACRRSARVVRHSNQGSEALYWKEFGGRIPIHYHLRYVFSCNSFNVLYEEHTHTHAHTRILYIYNYIYIYIYVYIMMYIYIYNFLKKMIDNDILCISLSHSLSLTLSLSIHHMYSFINLHIHMTYVIYI